MFVCARKQKKKTVDLQKLYDEAVEKLRKDRFAWLHVLRRRMSLHVFLMCTHHICELHAKGFGLSESYVSCVWTWKACANQQHGDGLTCWLNLHCFSAFRTSLCVAMSDLEQQVLDLKQQVQEQQFRIDEMEQRLHEHAYDIGKLFVDLQKCSNKLWALTQQLVDSVTRMGSDLRMCF